MNNMIKFFIEKQVKQIPKIIVKLIEINLLLFELPKKYDFKNSFYYCQSSNKLNIEK